MGRLVALNSSVVPQPCSTSLFLKREKAFKTESRHKRCLHSNTQPEVKSVALPF